MKKVLIVSYYFPPSGGAGVQRMLKFVKYLPEFGWEPVVLTVNEDADFPARDASLLEEIPSVIRTYRTRIFEPYGLYRKFTGKEENAAIDIATNTGEERRSIGERISSFVRATFFVPDARRFWKGPAVRTGKRILKRENVDLIFSSAPPYTCHLVGRALKRHSGLPWVADFRDSWVGWLSTPDRWFLPHRIDRRLERTVLEQSDGLIAVSDGVREDLMSRNPDIPSDKWHLITNGYDSADFDGIQSRPDPNRFVLTYTGSLYGKRSPLVLLDALSRLLEEKPELEEKVLFRFVGRADSSFIEEFLRFGKSVEYKPYVTHRESLQFIMDSSALLLIIDDAPANRSIATGKLYEYIGSRKPIFALAPDGAAGDLIRSLNAGVVVHPKNLPMVKKALLDYITQWEQGRLPKNQETASIQRYERKQLTKAAADIFDQAVKSAF